MFSRHPQFDQAAALIHAGRISEAAILLRQLAAGNDPLALNTLAEMTWSGIVAQDPVAARTLFERAAAAGYGPAAQRVTNLLASGIAGARDWPGALDRLRREAANNPARARALVLLDKMRLDANGNPMALPAAEPLSASPDVTLYRNVFTTAECDYVCTLNEAAFQRAMVLDGGRKPILDPIRTSDVTTLNWLLEDPAVHALNRRLAAISGTDAEQGEAAQVLRYQPGQQYRSHYDYQLGAQNQRIKTVLVYLNHDYKGGETTFLKTGLKVRGRRGDAIVFINTTADGRRDDMAEHAGMPVTSGIKFLLSRWIRAYRCAP